MPEYGMTFKNRLQRNKPTRIDPYADSKLSYLSLLQSKKPSAP